jgi:signal transduction histidine kinase
MENLIKLHQIEILREHLTIEIKRAQTDLYLWNTRHERSLDMIVNNVRSMSATVDACFHCHHAETVQERLVSLRAQTEEFKNALSRIITLRADRLRRQVEEDRAYQLGAGLLDQVKAITDMTHPRLETRTRAAFAEVRSTRKFLHGLLVVTPLLVLGLSIVFLRRFTKPVIELLTATRRLKGGDLDYRVPALPDEYGEVAASFNDMASSLKEQYLRMQWAEQLFILGELSGGLAHEIKNPLAGVKASLEVLVADSHLPAEDRDILQQSIEQIRRIEALLKNLLNFARPPKPQFMPVDVNGVLDATITLAKRLPLFNSSGGRNIRIEKLLGHGDFGIMADPLQLQQVFMNLLINAGEAMPEGGTVTVQTFLDPKEPHLQITVTDTGQGIDPGLAEKIFQPFYTTKAKGTGLGLSITKRLIEQHGGSIRAANNADRGVSFFITLPTQPHKEPAA